MKAFLALLVVVGAASANLSTVVDDIIQQTRSRIKNDLDFPPLSYKDGRWDPDFTKYDVTAELDTPAGKVTFGDFSREQAPVMWGSPKDGGVETRFFVQSSTVTFDKFSVLNHTSGEGFTGQLTVNFGRTEMYSIIKMKSQGKSCITSVSTLTPISIGEAAAKFVPDVELTRNLWTDAEGYLNYPLNTTLVHAAWPAFAEVVAKTDLCSLLS